MCRCSSLRFADDHTQGFSGSFRHHLFSLLHLLGVFNLHSFGFQVGSGLVGDDDAFTSGGTISARVESSYIINLRDLGMKHVKDFVFLHGKLPRKVSPLLSTLFCLF